MTGELRLHNTLARARQEFRPLDAGHVRMYVCGPTVYDDIHIGNARPLVVFDVLYRLLRQRYPRVTYVRNITDIDDKILARARDGGETVDALTARTAADFGRAAAALGCLVPDHEPRATAHVDGMIALVSALVGSGHAYAADGHVLFHVPSDAAYGRLSGRSREEMVAGARIETAPYKRDPADFVLWKPSAGDEPGWDSPWGRGRPGWHIECSAMSERYLGADFDIHGGGQDLVFPHHENELAQSTAGRPGCGFARFWLHNGHVMSEGEKMAKSAGNFYTVRDLLGDFPGEALRLALLQARYRQPLDFSRARAAEARQVLDRLYAPLRAAAGIEADGTAAPGPVRAALEDDLNTPLALRRLSGLAGTLGRAVAAGGSAAAARAKGDLLAAGALLGLVQDDPQAWFRRGTDAEAAEIDALVAARGAARETGNFGEADRIRDRLAGRGILLEDRPDGTVWRRAG